MVDLNDVVLFVQVVHAGSFAEAARRLGLPPNRASRSVQALERALGLRLMQRSTRKLALTDAGQNFYRRCVDHVEALTQAAADVAEGSEVPRGKIRVAAMAEFLHWFSVGFLSEFLAEHPEVDLEFVLSDARTDLLGESIDVAFRAGKTIEPNLIARQIGWIHAVLVASPAYLEARGTPKSPSELSAHDCVTWPTGTVGYSVWRLDGLEGEIEISVKGRFHANSAQAQVDAALANLGVALVPTTMVAAHIESGQLLRVLPAYGLCVGVYLVYLSRRQLPRAVSAFTEFATKKMIDQRLAEPVSALGQLGKGARSSFSGS